jgi:hypothetical protein
LAILYECIVILFASCCICCSYCLLFVAFVVQNCLLLVAFVVCIVCYLLCYSFILFAVTLLYCYPLGRV